MDFRNMIKYILVGSAFILLIAACEDVIEVTPDSADPLIVVDAWLTTASEDQTIYLNQSQPYFDNSLPTPVTGANVIVEATNGAIHNFIENDAGVYTWMAGTDSLGPVGTGYNLIINWNGNDLISQSEARRVPVIDSIGQEIEEETIRGPAGIYTNFYARDPQGFGDTYWIKTFKNGNYLNKPGELNIAYDAGFDAGAQVDGLIYITPIRELTNPIPDDDLDEPPPPWIVGDNIKVEIHSISNEAFFFLETTRDQINNGDNGLFAIPLANTKGNVINQTSGATVLGMFNVAVVSSITEIIE